MLPMVLYGPIAGPNACYRWSCMGPVLAPWNATDGLAWAQHWPQCTLLMVLHGPRAGPSACYRWSCMDPSLGPQHATDGLLWAQCWPPSMLPALNEPTSGP